MKITAQYFPYTLCFKKPVSTSRGSMQTHKVYYVRLQQGDRIGWGEAAPLPDLSIDDIDTLPTQIDLCCNLVNEGLPIDALPLLLYPSLRFAFEMANLMLKNEAPMCLFDTPFYRGKEGVEINGLVWMDDSKTMLTEALAKVESGYSCIKFKVGALDFDEECRMIEQVRRRANAFKLTIRLDANGAFDNDDALEKLTELARFDIHSIEQPIKPMQDGLMQEICAKSKIDIALDEDLIGRNCSANYLKKVKPKYIILKPTLLGGLSQSDDWADIANSCEIGWWATSALESNIGLNAIAQWCSTRKNTIPQGLGTGYLYTNNVQSSLFVKNAQLYNNPLEKWDIDQVHKKNF
jgi:o-succinylbenzoate synthase